MLVSAAFLPSQVWAMSVHYTAGQIATSMASAPGLYAAGGLMGLLATAFCAPSS